MKYPIDVFDDIVVPEADYTVTERGEVAISLMISSALGVLTAIELDNQALLTTYKVDVIWANRLLAGELESIELPIANPCPKLQLC